MDNEDHLALLQAGEGVQAPLLQRAVADARGRTSVTSARAKRAIALSSGLEDIKELGSPERKAHETYRLAFEGISAFASRAQTEAQNEGDSDSADDWKAIVDTLRSKQFNWGGPNTPWELPLSPLQRQVVAETLAELGAIVLQLSARAGVTIDALSNFDAPTYYSLEDLYRTYLPRRVDAESRNDPRMRNYVAPLVLRLGRLLADRRYDFLTRVPRISSALTRFLRFVLGRRPLRSEEDLEVPWAAAYNA